MSEKESKPKRTFRVKSSGEVHVIVADSIDYSAQIKDYPLTFFLNKMPIACFLTWDNFVRVDDAVETKVLAEDELSAGV